MMSQHVKLVVLSPHPTFQHLDWNIYQVYQISDPRAIPKSPRLDLLPVEILEFEILPDWTFSHDIYIVNGT